VLHQVTSVLTASQVHQHTSHKPYPCFVDPPPKPITYINKTPINHPCPGPRPAVSLRLSWKPCLACAGPTLISPSHHLTWAIYVTNFPSGPTTGPPIPAVRVSSFRKPHSSASPTPFLPVPEPTDDDYE
jgi:hypothetical protein